MFLIISQNNGIEVTNMKNKNFENRTAIFPQLKNKDGKLSRDERKILRFFASILIDILGDDILEKYNQKHGKLEDDN